MLDDNLNALPGWPRFYGGTAYENASQVFETDDHGFMIIGGITANNANEPQDILIYRLNATGNVSWDTSFTISGDDRAYGIAKTGANEYVIAGSTKAAGGSAFRGYAFKFHDYGTHADSLWTRIYGAPSTTSYWFNDIHRTADNGFIIGGTSDLAPASAMYALKLDDAGIPQCSLAFEDSRQLTGQAILACQNGGYVLVGGVREPAVNDSLSMFVLFMDDNLRVSVPLIYAYSTCLQTVANDVIQVDCGRYAIGGTVCYTQAGRYNYDALILEIDDCGHVLGECAFGSDSLSENPAAIAGGAAIGYILAGITERRRSDGGINYDTWMAKASDISTLTFRNVTASYLEADTALALQWCADGCCDFTIYSCANANASPPPEGWKVEAVLHRPSGGNVTWLDSAARLINQRKYYQIIRECP